MSGQLDGIRELRPDSDQYPRQLLELPSPPNLLYVAGTIYESDSDAIAVVGSRRASEEARTAAHAIGRALAAAGHTVVSGLADGVDSAAHRGALSIASGRTIAVVGTGLLHTYPPVNVTLERLIRTRGAVVSQYPPNQGPRPEAFARRNELIAGLSKASVVVIAEERSGTRHTIDFTFAQRKPVIFWKPLMMTADWARRLVAAGVAVFAEDVVDVIERAASAMR